MAGLRFVLVIVVMLSPIVSKNPGETCKNCKQAHRHHHHRKHGPQGPQGHQGHQWSRRPHVVPAARDNQELTEQKRAKIIQLIQETMSMCTIVEKTRGTCRELCILENLAIMDDQGLYLAREVARLAPAIADVNEKEALKLAHRCDYVNEQRTMVGCEKALAVLDCLGITKDDFDEV